MERKRFVGEAASASAEAPVRGVDFWHTMLYNFWCCCRIPMFYKVCRHKRKKKKKIKATFWCMQESQQYCLSFVFVYSKVKVGKAEGSTFEMWMWCKKMKWNVAWSMWVFFVPVEGLSLFRSVLLWGKKNVKNVFSSFWYVLLQPETCSASLCFINKPFLSHKCKKGTRTLLKAR